MSRVESRSYPLLTSALALMVWSADGRAQEAAPAPGGGAQALPPVVVESQRRTAPRRTRATTAQPATARPRPAPVVEPQVSEEAAPTRPGEAAWGPVQGYVASRSLTATKTDTPLIETPQSISVITRDQMTAQGVGTLAQALRYTPGVSGEMFGGDSRCYGLQIRGFQTWGQSFYKDGMQLRAPYFVNFQCLDPYGAERLEVLRGPASSLYGQGDPGGIINYVSKRPLYKPFYEVELGVGSFENREGRFDFSGPVNRDNTLFYRLTGLVRDADTQVDYVANKRVFVQPSFTWQPNADTTLTVLGHYQHDKSGWTLQFLPAYGTIFGNPNGKIPTSRFTGEPSWDRIDTTTATLGYLFEHRADETWTFRQNVRYAFLESEQRGVFGSAFAIVDPENPANPANYRTLNRYGDYGATRLNAFTVDNQAQAKFATGPLAHTLLLGADFQHQHFSDLGGGTTDVGTIDLFNPVYNQMPEAIRPSGAPYQDTTQTQNQIGLYAQDQIKLGGWVLDLSGRHDWVKSRTAERSPLQTPGTTTQADSQFTGRAGLLYRFDNGIAPYASYATSFLPLLGKDLSTGQPFVPEEARQYEVGVKYQPPGWNMLAAIAAFDLCKQNALTADPNNPNNSIQTGEICSRGIEVEGVASLTKELNLRAAYTYLDTEFTKDTTNQGRVPYGIPRHRASVWADYTMTSGALAGLGFGGGVRYIGRTWGDDANTFRVPSALLFDATIHYDWRGFRFAVTAQNVFDKVYADSCSGIDSCYYGSRRTVLASARYRW